MGRKKDTDAAKVLRGTFRKDRSTAPMPEPSPESLTVPGWLSDSAFPYFEELQDRLSEIGLNSCTFSGTVALAALRLDEIDRCGRDIAEHGESFPIDSMNGSYRKENPSVAQRDRALRHLHKLYEALCLTPQALAKAPGKEQKKTVQGFGAL